MRAAILEAVKERAVALWKERGLLGEPVAVAARTLTAQEAIGDPERDDFPIQKGKERLMEASFLGARGQAFTDRFGGFSGSLGDVAALELTSNYRRAVFVATLNASLRALGLCERTVHCRDRQPGECAATLAGHLAARFGKGARVALVGLQPAMLEALAGAMPVRVLDLDPDNIGRVLHGVEIAGPDRRAEVLGWADVLAVTGSTLANDTLGEFLGARPALFYGTTVAGAAALMGWERFCPLAG